MESQKKFVRMELIFQHGVIPDPQDPKLRLWHYSDINKNGRTTTEDAVITLEHDAWRYYNMPFKRWRIITPMYDWTNPPVVQHEGTQYQEDDAPTNQQSTVEYDYINDKRTTSTIYTFSNADTWSGNPIVEDPVNVSIFSMEEYDNGECDMSTYEYVDNLQVRKHYTGMECHMTLMDLLKMAQNGGKKLTANADG